ncbi:MAG TPA: hypothetical protein VGQ18_12975 [Gemmatimonadales bacterium]|nr:hypothetical protein [Gemmatimonadales bacterium]
MRPRLECYEVPELPKLAWVATVDLHSSRVRAFHGSAVERGRGWLVEGVWDGDFAAGGFHRTGQFFGSGIRIEADAVYFVPSSALTDRLFTCRTDQSLVVANSLCLLLAYTGARLDPEHDYRRESQAIRQGLRAYDPAFHVQHPAVDRFEQLYYHRLVVSGGTVTRETPPAPAAIPSFTHYEQLLRDTLTVIAANAASPRRHAPLALCATVSAGYDSPAVAALVKDLGVEACFTAHRSTSAIPGWLNRHAVDDDGTPIATALGLASRKLGTARSQVTEDELYFLAACASMPALAFHSMARDIEGSGRVALVFTGFQGDYVWDVNVETKHLNDDFTGCDTSGVTLSEIRLKSGFINAAVPFLFARAIPDLALIGASREMTPWRSRPDYDRPIARRIAEAAGVPRGAFGQRKRAVVAAYDYPVHPRLRGAFLAQLAAEGIGPARVYLHSVANRVLYRVARALAATRRALTGIGERTPHALVGKQLDLPRRLFVWAGDALADRLAAVLPARDVAAPAALRSPPAAILNSLSHAPAVSPR